MNFHQKTELTFSNFLSGQRAENTSFGRSPCCIGGSHAPGSTEEVQCWLHLGTTLCTKSSLGASHPHSPLTCSNSLLLPPAASPNPSNQVTHPTDSGSPKPSWGKPRPQLLCRAAHPAAVKSQGYRGSATCQQIERHPLLCRALEYTSITLNPFPRGWICLGRAEGCIK